MRISHPLTGKSKLINALLDTGADRDFISPAVAEYLNLDIRNQFVSIATVEGFSEGIRQLTDITISSETTSFDVDIEDAVIGFIAAGNNDIPPARRNFSHIPQFKDLPFLDAGGPIEMIIDTGHATSWLTCPHLLDPKSHLAAIKTDFGWTVLGREVKKGAVSPSCASISVAYASIIRDVDKIFMHDFPAITQEQIGTSLEDQRTVKFLEDNMEFDDDIKRFVSPIPWTEGRAHAAAILNQKDSNSMAIRRLLRMVPKFNKDPEQKKRIFDTVAKLEASGYVDKDIPAEDFTPDRPTWYLPLHVVEKDIEGRGKKTRVCHDARAAVDGVFPNDLISGGPNLINDPIGILLRSMAHRILVTTDISNFFFRIRVDKEDANAFCYYWFDNYECTEYSKRRFNSHIFGGKGSSIVSSMALRIHAARIRELYPENVSDAIRDDVFVDDMHIGDENVPDARTATENLDEAMEKGGFPLSKWKSNRREVFDGRINAGEQTYGKPEDDDSKILGVSWKPSKDIFTFEFSKEKIAMEVITARQLVSVQSSIYDPLGFISPFILLGRQLLQKATVANSSWDAILPADIQDAFAAWQKSIPLLANIEIPRWWNTEATADSVDEELHVFSDAAATGYGVAAYRRVTGSDGSIHVSMLSAKSHVVPINPARASHHGSIPRLELTAAVKAVEVATHINNVLRRKIEKVLFWTDSECVLKQIRDTTTSFKTFYMHRLSQIHALSKPTQWNFVSSGDNTGDYPSRGIRAEEQEKWRRFHRGPEFLWKTKEHWPKPFVSSSTTNRHIDDALRRPTAATTNASIFLAAASVDEAPEPPPVSGYIQIADRLGNYESKIKRIAAFSKFILFWKVVSTTRNTRSTPNFHQATACDYSDFRDAEKKLVQAIQRRHFHPEIEKLKSLEITSPTSRQNLAMPKSRLTSLNPFLDDEGIIRLGGRLANAPIDEEKRFPAILPNKDSNVKDMMFYIHKNEFHRGPNHTLAVARNKFWILQGLQTAKNAIHRCIPCQKAFKKPEEQRMAPLPVERVSFNAPFQVTGVDMMGPFKTLMNGRAPQKIWVAVFSCFSSRAVHVETVQKMDAASFINAIIRFSSRRPGLKKLVSDNGTNFVGSNAILRKEMEVFRAASVENLAAKGIEWSFIPPHTPHYGGVWERIVGLFKRMLATLGKGEATRYDVFNTTIIEMEATLNRRPLCPISQSPDDAEALTPAHILYPATFAHSSAVIIPSNEVNEAEALRSTWKRAQARVNACKKMFFREYVTILHQRNKWTNAKNVLKINDLVILVDESIPRQEWKMARVVEMEGSDGLTRRVRVIRADKKFSTHDRTKVVRLETA